MVLPTLRQFPVPGDRRTAVITFFARSQFGKRQCIPLRDFTRISRRRICTNRRYRPVGLLVNFGNYRRNRFGIVEHFLSGRLEQRRCDIQCLLQLSIEILQRSIRPLLQVKFLCRRIAALYRNENIESAMRHEPKHRALPARTSDLFRCEVEIEFVTLAIRRSTDFAATGTDRFGRRRCRRISWNETGPPPAGSGGSRRKTHLGEHIPERTKRGQ